MHGCRLATGSIDRVRDVLTDVDCNLSRVKSSTSLVPRKKDTFGLSHTISLVESSVEKL